MNIGITVYPTYGGSGIVGSELGKELAARGHNVHFISSALPTRLTELNERVHFHEVEMMSYPLFEHQPYTLALATKMATVAENENLDLLHVHYAIPHSISAILARESIRNHRRLPVITTLHGTDITLVGADRSYLPITRYALEQSDGVTAISKYLKQATIDTFQFDLLQVIPNFVCPEDYKPQPDCQLRAQLAIWLWFVVLGTNKIGNHLEEIELKSIDSRLLQIFRNGGDPIRLLKCVSGYRQVRSVRAHQRNVGAVQRCN